MSMAIVAKNLLAISSTNFVNKRKTKDCKAAVNIHASKFACKLGRLTRAKIIDSFAKRSSLFESCDAKTMMVKLTRRM